MRRAISTLIGIGFMAALGCDKGPPAAAPATAAKALGAQCEGQPAWVGIERCKTGDRVYVSAKDRVTGGFSLRMSTSESRAALRPTESATFEFKSSEVLDTFVCDHDEHRLVRGPIEAGGPSARDLAAYDENKIASRSWPGP